MQGICFPLFCAVALLLWPHGRARVVEQLLETAQKPNKVFCDDKDVVAGVDLALVTHNAKLLQGNQLALYQIVDASKYGPQNCAQNSMCAIMREFFGVVNEPTTLFDLFFLVRESDCPVGGDKEWRDCDYLAQPDTVAPSTCTAVLSRRTAEERLAIVSVDCRPPVVRTLIGKVEAHTTGGSRKIDVASESLKEPMSYSLSKFNEEDDSSHHFLLREIVSAEKSVINGIMYDIEFNLEKSNCSKSDFEELTEDCHPTETEPEFAKCNSTVIIAPWRMEEPDVYVNCERVLETAFLPTTQEPAVLLPPTPEPARPFNCPTKPWKPFVPLVLK